MNYDPPITHATYFEVNENQHVYMDVRNDMGHDMGESSKKKCLWEGLLKDMTTCDSIKGVSLLALMLTMSVLRKEYDKDPRLLNLSLSYITLYNLIYAMQLRLMFPLMMQVELGTSFNAVFETEVDFSEFCAFVETFLAVLEVECLTHMCIDRYVVAKYATNGWPLGMKHYALYVVLSVIFSLLYATPPLYGIGRFGDEFTCNSYTVDYILPDSWQKYVIMFIFFLRSVKPVAFMILMLIAARYLEWNMKASMKKHVDVHFTRMVIILTLCNLTCWAPLAWIKAKLMLNQLINDQVVKPKSAPLVTAVCLQDFAPLLSAIVILLFHYTRNLFAN